MRNFRVFFLLIFTFILNSSLNASFLGFPFGPSPEANQNQRRGAPVVYSWLGGSLVTAYPLQSQGSARGLNYEGFHSLQQVLDDAAKAYQREQEEQQVEQEEKEKAKAEKKRAKKAQYKARRKAAKKQLAEEAEAKRLAEEAARLAKEAETRLAKEAEAKRLKLAQLAEEEELRRVLGAARLAEEEEAKQLAAEEQRAAKAKQLAAVEAAKAKQLEAELEKRRKLRASSGSPWGNSSLSRVDFRSILQKEKQKNNNGVQEQERAASASIQKDSEEKQEEAPKTPAQGLRAAAAKRSKSPELIAQEERRKKRIKDLRESPETVSSFHPWAQKKIEEECDEEFQSLSMNHSSNAREMEFLEQKTAKFTKTILNPFFADKPSLKLVLNGGYLVRSYARGFYDHSTDDVDLFLVDEEILREEGEPDFNGVRTALQKYFYEHREELGEDAYLYEVRSDLEYGIKVSYRTEGGLKALMDMGFSKKAYEKVLAMGLCREHDETLKKQFSVPCTLLKFEAYLMDLEDRIWGFLDAESELSLKYKHKLPSWKSQLYTLYSLQWERLSLEEKIYFLDLYRKLPSPENS